MKLSIVIPAYNEKQTLAALLDSVLSLDLAPHAKEVIVVDDGSTDGTNRIQKTYAGRVVTLAHQHNRGKGAAVRTGFAHASGEYVVVQDADLEYDPHDLRRMLDVALEHNAPVVYGSRRLPMDDRKNVPARWYFFWGGLFLTWLTNVLYGTHITDEPTCYKMVRRDVLSRISLSSNGFEFCPEITAKIARLGIPIREVPIRYTPRSVEEGKKIRPRDGLVAIWTLLRHRF